MSLGSRIKFNEELNEPKRMGTARKKTKRRSDSHNLFNLRAEYKSKIFVINSDKKKEKKTAYFKEY